MKRMRAIRAVHRLATWLVIGIGAVHTLATFYFYEGPSEASTWFAGAGLGAIFAAFLNVSLWQPSAPRWAQNLTAAANALFFLWLVLGLVSTPQAPQMAVFTIGSAMSVGGLVLWRQGSGAAAEVDRPEPPASPS